MHPKIHRDHINPEQNLGVLLMEFFELYGRNFYYDVDGISLLRGGSYYRKSRKGFYNSQRPFLLSIEDPQQPGRSSVLLISPLLPRSSDALYPHPRVS